MSRALFFAVMIFAAPAFAEARFFTGIDDLPLAPGLEETAPFSFDGAGGRIAGAAARGQASPASVRAFYVDTLPALGWSPSPGAGGEGELVYLRGRERLSLTVAAAEGGAEITVRLFTRPSPAD